MTGTTNNLPIMLSAGIRRKTLHKILIRDRRSIERRLAPTNGTKVQKLSNGRAYDAHFEIDGFRAAMWGRRSRYSENNV